MPDGARSDISRASTPARVAERVLIDFNIGTAGPGIGVVEEHPPTAAMIQPAIHAAGPVRNSVIVVFDQHRAGLWVACAPILESVNVPELRLAGRIRHIPGVEAHHEPAILSRFNPPDSLLRTCERGCVVNGVVFKVEIVGAAVGEWIIGRVRPRPRVVSSEIPDWKLNAIKNVVVDNSPNLASYVDGGIALTTRRPRVLKSIAVDDEVLERLRPACAWPVGPNQAVTRTCTINRKAGYFNGFVVGDGRSVWGNLEHGSITKAIDNYGTASSGTRQREPLRDSNRAAPGAATGR